MSQVIVSAHSIASSVNYHEARSSNCFATANNQSNVCKLDELIQGYMYSGNIRIAKAVVDRTVCCLNSSCFPKATRLVSVEAKVTRKYKQCLFPSDQHCPKPAAFVPNHLLAIRHKSCQVLASLLRLPSALGAFKSITTAAGFVYKHSLNLGV